MDAARRGFRERRRAVLVTTASPTCQGRGVVAGCVARPTPCLHEHLSDLGSPLVRAMSGAGILVRVVRTGPGDHRVERAQKKVTGSSSALNAARGAASQLSLPALTRGVSLKDAPSRCSHRVAIAAPTA